MRIVCPSCDAAYQVPEAVLARAPAMRCARCGHDWSPVAAAPAPPEPVAAPAPAPLAAPAPAPAPISQPIPELIEDPSDAARPWPLRLAWALSLLLLLGAGVAAVLWRGPLVAAWPPLARLFGALGLAV